VPVDLHAGQNLGDLDLTRPVGDQSEAALFGVLNEKDHALVKKGIHHLRHGQQQNRGLEITELFGHT
jgi:hypothetical protein